jgi:hypothetical protein
LKIYFTTALWIFSEHCRGSFYFGDGIAAPDSAAEPLGDAIKQKMPLAWLFLFIANTSFKQA